MRKFQALSLSAALLASLLLADVWQLRSRWFTLQTEVEYAGAQAVLSALLHADGDRARLIVRRWTPDE